MNKAIFFDRDGTLIVDKVYLNDPAKIEYYPDTFTALKEIQKLGYIFIVVTNQSGVPRGLVELKNLHTIHRLINNNFRKHKIHINGFYYAPHMVDSGHPDRKPGNGMLLKAAKDHQIDLQKSWMIGDQITDVMAGIKSGTKTILLQTGTDQKEILFESTHKPTGVFKNLTETAAFIASQN
jgi:D-glycero-D-manno-heptose 1,7-bisphosphate phosphatase